jgi:hypothetical protein
MIIFDWKMHELCICFYNEFHELNHAVSTYRNQVNWERTEVKAVRLVHHKIHSFTHLFTSKLWLKKIHFLLSEGQIWIFDLKRAPREFFRGVLLKKFITPAASSVRQREVFKFGGYRRYLKKHKVTTVL